MYVEANKNTNQLIYKTVTDAQIQKINLYLSNGKGEGEG